MSLKTGLLISANPKSIGNFINSVKLDILGTLYVKLLCELKLDALQTNITNTTVYVNKTAYRRTVLDFYGSLKHIPNLDVRVLLSNFRDPEIRKIHTSKPIEVIYVDSSYSQTAVHSFVTNFIANKSNGYEISVFPKVTETYASCFANAAEHSEINFEEYDYSVLGGTFDRIHTGHKLLLTEAVLRSRKRLTVRICSENMLKSKILPEFIEDCSIRMETVKEFLCDVEPRVEYDIGPLYDLYGPTKTDPLLQVGAEVIIVSEESLRGAQKINEYRKEHGLNELVVQKIEVIESETDSKYEENKISSSNRRMRLLGELIKPPQPRPHLPKKPYIIGLTGGIGSGKSTIMEYFEEMGCGCINCDLVAHKVYDKGSEGHEFIVKTFGSGILNEDGSVNRKEVAKIVFNDESQLNKLNNGIWPLVRKEVKRRTAELSQDKEVVILEAALLIQANWVEDCHEIWTCIVPPEEAVKRLQERNKLSEEEAQLRIKSQPTNKEYVAKSNVIFCSLWDPGYTRSQFDKAWLQLGKRLKTM